MFLPFFVPPFGVCSSERNFNALIRPFACVRKVALNCFWRSFVVIDALAHVTFLTEMEHRRLRVSNFKKSLKAVLVGRFPLHVRAKERGLLEQTTLCL